MAERNVVYQRNRRSLNIPQVDYTNAKAVAAGNSMLNQSINRLTAFMESQAEITAQIEGAEYGAANSPTLEQIETSLKTGEDLELPGNKRGSVFERAARNATMEILHDELTFKARSEIIAASIDGKENNLTPVEMREKFDAIMSGYAATLDIEEPKFAKRLRAQIGVFSNAEYKSYTNDYVTKIKKQKQSQVLASIQISLNEVLPKLIEAGVSTQSASMSENSVATTEIIRSEKLQLVLRLQKAEFSAPKIKEILDEFDAAVVSSAKDTVSNFILQSENSTDATGRYRQLIENKGLPGNIDAALELLPASERDKVNELALDAVNDFITIEGQRITIEERREKLAKEQFQRKKNEALILQTKDFEDGSAALDKLIEDATGVAYVEEDLAELAASRPKLENIRIPNVSNEDTLFNFANDLNQNDPQLNIGHVTKAFQNGELTRADFIDYSNKYVGRLDTDIKDILRDARTELQLPEGFIINPNEDNERANALNALDNALNRAKRAGGPEFDPFVWYAENKDKYILTAETKIYNDNKNLVNKYNLSEAELEAIVSSQKTTNNVTPSTATAILEAAKTLDANDLPSNWKN